MRILIIGDSFSTFRGTQRMELETAKVLREKHDVRVWCYTDNAGETIDFFERAGIQTLVGAKNLPSLLDFSPDIVNIHHAGWPIELDRQLMRTFKLHGAKIIETSVFGHVDYLADRFIDLSLQISKWDLHRWNLRRGPFTRILGVYLPNIVDTDIFQRSTVCDIDKMKSSLGIPADATVIGRAGKTAWDAFLRPLLTALESNPTLHIISVSDYGGTAIPTELLQHPRVHTIPRRWTSQELSLFYSSCDYFLSASPIGESFGMVIAEAMACETPVIAWAMPQIDNAQAELVRHGYGGWLIKSPAELPSLISSLIAKKLPALLPGKSIRSSIVQRYSRPVVSKMLHTAFSAVHETNTSSDLRKRLSAAGFLFDIPAAEFADYVNHAIGNYSLFVRICQAFNLSYTLQKLYRLYKFLLGKK